MEIFLDLLRFIKARKKYIDKFGKCGEASYNKDK